jgi:hypothetical protein
MMMTKQIINNYDDNNQHDDDKADAVMPKKTWRGYQRRRHQWQWRKNVNDEGESNYKIINHDDDKDNNQYDADDDNGKANDDNNNDDDNGGNDDDNKKMTKTTTKTTKQIMNAPFIIYWILRMVNSNQTMKVWSCCGNLVGGTNTWCGFLIQITATEFWRDKKVSCKIGRKWIAVQTGKKQENGALRFQRKG